MKKQVIDCSKPIGHPEREKIVEMDAADLSTMVNQVVKEQEPDPVQVRLKALEDQLAVLAKSK